MNPAAYLKDIGLAFLGGAGVSWTPCIYPLIPIVLSVIGAQGAPSRLRGFFISGLYVLGMASAYSLLGIGASLTGKIFGQWLAHPATYLFAGILILFFGLWMIGVFSLPFLNFLKHSGKKPEGLLGVFILGFGSSFIVGPCTTPVLGSLLAYAGTRENIFFAGILLFSFALGMGLLLILAGTFENLLFYLPRSGKWLERIHRSFGWVLILIAFFLFFKAGKLWF